MMDMFTIILVFLLKTYAIEGSLIHPSDNLTLPKSTTQIQPEAALDLIVSKETIVVNDEIVERLENVRAQRGVIIEALRDRLTLYAEEAKRMEERFGIKFSGRVTIQGDKDLEYWVLVKVLATCGACEYSNLRLATYLQEGSSGAQEVVGGAQM
jgi:biopolymer transport protein ExbD